MAFDLNILKAGCAVLLFVTIPLTTTGCRAFDPDYAYVKQSNTVAQLTPDSPQVRQLIRDAELRDVEMMQSFRAAPNLVEWTDPGIYLPARNKLLADMAAAHSKTVTGPAYLGLKGPKGDRRILGIEDAPRAIIAA